MKGIPPFVYERTRGSLNPASHQRYFGWAICPLGLCALVTPAFGGSMGTEREPTAGLGMRSMGSSGVGISG